MSTKKSQKLCLFKPTRANQKACTLEATVEWGFCNKHARTSVQGKLAKKKYEEELQRQYEEDMKTLDKELENIDTTDEEEENNDTVKIVINPNAWGRFEDRETGILFYADTKTAYGIQGENGDIYDLDEEAIKVCVENGWAYVSPTVEEVSSEEEEPEEEEKGNEEPEEEEIEEDNDQDGDQEDEEEE